MAVAFNIIRNREHDAQEGGRKVVYCQIVYTLTLGSTAHVLTAAQKAELGLRKIIGVRALSGISKAGGSDTGYAWHYDVDAEEFHFFGGGDGTDGAILVVATDDITSAELWVDFIGY